MKFFEWISAGLFSLLLIALFGRSIIYTTRIWQEWRGHLQMNTRPEVRHLVNNCEDPAQISNQAEKYLYYYYALDKTCQN